MENRKGAQEPKQTDLGTDIAKEQARFGIFTIRGRESTTNDCACFLCLEILDADVVIDQSQLRKSGNPS
jgi:hypothetical protein